MTTTETDIDQLLVLCKKGNQLAQLEVYNRYQKAMYNIAFRIVKDTAEAEDVMQESFITAFEKLDSFKGNAAFGAWLKRIVVNKSFSQYKKNNRFVALREKEIVEEAEEDFVSIEEEDYTNTKVSKVLKCMEEIHSSYGQVLTLHLIEGYDYEECCKVLNISYANCRTLISRAKDSLRKKLNTL